MMMLRLDVTDQLTCHRIGFGRPLIVLLCIIIGVRHESFVFIVRLRYMPRAGSKVKANCRDEKAEYHNDGQHNYRR